MKLLCVYDIMQNSFVIEWVQDNQIYMESSFSPKNYLGLIVPQNPPKIKNRCWSRLEIKGCFLDFLTEIVIISVKYCTLNDDFSFKCILSF